MKMTCESEFERELDKIDEKVLKSMARIHVLCYIKRGSSHGYDIMQKAHEEFNIRHNPSAIYPLLQSLEDDGYIRGEWADEGYPRKKNYELTEKGSKYLAYAKERMMGLMGKINSEINS